MALVVKDRVRVNSVTAGTGTITLGSAILGFQDFSVIGDGNTTYYTIADPATGDWEVGIGTYTASGTTLSRDTILESSNAGSAVNFAANPKDVFVTYPAERAVYVEGSTVTPATAATLPVVSGGTGAATLTGYVKGSGTSALTASATIPNSDITGLGTMSTQDANNVAVTGGSINGTTIGASTASTGAFTTLAYTSTLTGGTGVIAIGTDQIYKDASGNVGIGTTTPLGSAKLTVNGAVYLGNSTDITPNSGWNGQLTVSGNGYAAGIALDASGMWLGTNSASRGIIFATNETERMRLTAAGELGIGTSSPATDLDVVGPAGVTSFTGTTKLGVAVRGSTAATDYSGIDFYGNSQTNPTARIGVLTTGNGSFLQFGTSNSYASGITTAGMTINDDGIVGVGTTSPADNVGFGAAVDVSSTVGGAIYFRDSDAPSTYVYVGYIGSNSTTYVWSTANGPILFGTNNAERMRVASGGAVSIGKTVDTVTGAGLVNDPSGLIRITRAGTGSATHVQFANNGGTQVGSISTSGSTTTYSTSSDYRLKENVAPMTGALAKVQALKPVTYTWKNDGSQGQGFIAHELQELVPEAVTGKKDAVDVNGKPEYQGVDTSALVATLVSAVQEQQVLIAKLQADVAALQGN